MWTVFWYGVSNPKMSYGIVDWAVNHKSSFLEADEEEDFTAVSEVGEPWQILGNFLELGVEKSRLNTTTVLMQQIGLRLVQWCNSVFGEYFVHEL